MRTRYEIVLRGSLPQRLEKVVDGFEVTSSDRSATRLEGRVDQGSLQGALRRVADLGLELVAVTELPGP